MIDWILAQVQSLDTTALLSGAGGAGATGFIVFCFLKKVAKHVDDASKHVPAGKTVVTDDMCLVKTGGLEKDVTENKEAIIKIHERLDDVIILLSDNQSTILTAIAKIKE